ncbi:MAG: hypothetical protein ACOZF0_15700 [Thermodesulfobacteriota bacterium]
MKLPFIQKLAENEFVRSAIDEKADLSAFRKRPSIRVMAGVFAIAFSYVIGWPAVSFLGILAAYLKEPLILIIGGPVVYGLSHVVFLAGMYLAGAEYSLIFLRWAARMAAEKLLNRFS